MGMTALTQRYLFDTQCLGYLGMMNRDAGKLKVVIPDTVIYGIIADNASEERVQSMPAARKIMAKASKFSGQAMKFPGIVDQQNVRAFYIQGILIYGRFFPPSLPP